MTSRGGAEPRYGFGSVLGWGPCSRVTTLVAVAASMGCNVYGLVGSNASAAFGSDDGDDEGGQSGAATSGAASTGSQVSDDDGAGSGGGGGGGDSDPVFFDVGVADWAEVCLAPSTTSCDHLDDGPWHALGVACDGFDRIETTFTGDPEALFVLEGTLGTNGVYSPREGERMVVLSTGRASDLPRSRADLGCDDVGVCLSTALQPDVQLTTLPPPIDVGRVHESKNCFDDPSLVGTGDCSNTLQEEWDAGQGTYDYAEMRLVAKVPEEADAIVYQFAFFSAEYPGFSANGEQTDMPFNDMYIAWLESEAWTGNISFDELGHPISINGVFLDYLDAESPLCTKDPCVAPELDGFAMDGHAGTRWLETIAPVVPGEEIELIFALFDMTDAIVDTAVVLDGVHWGCSGQPPVTSPAG
ncbi:MAG: choice-of-anchor L domain-containing protein [Myxococcota bacterium]